MTAKYDAFVDLLVDRFNIERAIIKPDTTFADLDIDSLFLVELILVAEHEFGVTIGEDALYPTDTVVKAARVIEDELAGSTS